MATIGAINVAVNAYTDGFEKGMERAGKAAHGFNAHVLTSRHGLQTFAGLTGQAVGPISHLVHAIELIPGPIGVALGALLLLREHFEHAAEEAKKYTESIDKLREQSLKLNQAMGLEAPDDKFSPFIKTASENLAKMRTEIHETNASIMGFWANTQGIGARLIGNLFGGKHEDLMPVSEPGTERQQEIIRLNQQMIKDTERAREEADRKEFNNTRAKIRAEIALDEQRLQIKINEENTKYWDTRKKLADNLFDSVRLPEEVFEDQLKNILNLAFEEQITNETAKRAIKQAEDVFKNSEEKAALKDIRPTTTGLGTFNLENVTGLRGGTTKKQEVHSEAADKANEILMKIEKKLGVTTTARTT